MYWSWLSVFCVICSLAYSRAEKDVGTNSTSQLLNFCRRFEHRTAVLNNKLYIDGGYVNSDPLDQDPNNYTNTLLFYSDLLVNNLGMPSVNNSVKNISIPSLAGGLLWADDVNDVFYAFGGYFPSSTPTPFATWAFRDSSQSWNTISARGDAMSYVAHGAGDVSPDAGVGYYLGGYHDDQTNTGWRNPRIYTSNLIEFDMINWRYSNNSGPDNIGRGEGLMIFIPASTSGLLIYFGGVIQDPSTGELSGVPMSNITIYDISLKKWYTQQATGNVPDERVRFCGGAAWPDDKSSFNIYLYGGLRPSGANINGTTAFDDIYILSIPAFVWIKYYPTVAGTAFPHHSLTCNIINGTQMIIMGGTFPNSTFCDTPSVYGQHSADLGQNNPDDASFALFRQDDPPYVVPTPITKLIGGTSKGGANATGPLVGTPSYDFYLFQRPYMMSTRSPTPTSAPPKASAPTSNVSLSRNVLIGAVVGSVLGGVLLAIAALAAIRFLRKRRAESEKPDTSQQTEKDQGKMLDDGKNIPPSELNAATLSELPEEHEPATEMWAQPVELPTSPVRPSENGQ